VGQKKELKSFLSKNQPGNFAGVAIAETQQVQTTASRKKLTEESKLSYEEHKEPCTSLPNTLEMPS